MEIDKDLDKDLDEFVIDADYLDQANIEINPDLFIRNTLLKAEQALTKENVEEGFLQYWRLIEHLETLSKAANRLPSGYDESITQFKLDNKEDKNKEIIKSVKLADYKLQLLLSEIFQAKVNKNPIPLKF